MASFRFRLMETVQIPDLGFCVHSDVNISPTHFGVSRLGAVEMYSSAETSFAPFFSMRFVHCRFRSCFVKPVNFVPTDGLADKFSRDIQNYVKRKSLFCQLTNIFIKLTKIFD